MNQRPERPWYRMFQKVAIGVGGIGTVVGIALRDSHVIACGAVILVHGIAATLVLMFDDRRKPQ